VPASTVTFFLSDEYQSVAVETIAKVNMLLSPKPGDVSSKWVGNI
jgi:hypothetical protein